MGSGPQNGHLTHPSLSVPLSSKESIENCRSLPSDPLGEFSKDSPDSEKPWVISPMDQRFGRGAGVTEISGSDDKCMLCRDVSGRAGVEVLCGMKLCGLLEPTFEDKLCILASSRSRSKLLVDFAGLRDEKLRDGEGVTRGDDRRLLSLALETPNGTRTILIVKKISTPLSKISKCLQLLVANQKIAGALARTRHIAKQPVLQKPWACVKFWEKKAILSLTHSSLLKETAGSS